MSPANQKRKAQIMLSVNERCTALAEKLESLHHKVIKPVEKAGEAVSSTVGKVTETVSTARQVVDSVGEQVSKWPWLSLAGSLVAGVGTGLIINGHSAHATDQPDGAEQTQPPKPGFLAEQFNKLTGLAVGAGLAAVRDLVKVHAPSLAGVADHFTEDLTQQFGAVPFSAPILQPTGSFCETGI